MTNIFKSVIEFCEGEAWRGRQKPSKLYCGPNPSSHVFPIADATAAACIESISANIGTWGSRIVVSTYLTFKTESWSTFNRNCYTLINHFSIVRDNRPWILEKGISQCINIVLEIDKSTSSDTPANGSQTMWDMCSKCKETL